MESSTHFNSKKGRSFFSMRLRRSMKFRTVILFLFCFSLGFTVTAQEKDITGVVTDQDQVPLPGVNVMIKNTSTGTQTNFDGEYSLKVNQGDVLVFSYQGFKTTETTVDDSSTFTVSLEEDVSKLDEVVVTGYGKQSRNRLTTSVSTMDTRVLETSTRSNAATALQGEVPGLKITNTSGQPGSTPQITLRGGTDFNGSGTPLILIDGVPGSFYALNPSDIESMDVLKDAAATAIYGARAADGVILITTKKGTKGKSSIHYEQTYSFNYKRQNTNYLDAADFIKYNRQAVLYYNEASGLNNFDASFLNGPTAFGTGNNTTDTPFTTQYLTDDNRYLLDHGWSTVTDPVDPSKEILYHEYDMADDIYQSSRTIDHTLSFQGGNEKGTFYASFGYLDNQGLILGSGFKRYSGNLSGTYNIKDNFKVNANILYSHSKQNTSPLGSDDRVFRRYAGQAPTARSYNNNPDGTWSDELNPGTNSGFGNPLYYKDKFVKDNLEQRITANLGVEWNIVPDLTFKVNGSHFAVNNYNQNFNKAYMNGGAFNDTRRASASLDKILSNQLNATINYSHTFDQHHIDALLGTEYYSKKNSGFSAATKNSPTDLIPTLNAGSEADGVPSSSETKHVITSGFGRLNYDFDQKYLLQFNFRYDGSSRLGNNKFGFFPGISLGWNAHDEDFIKNSGFGEVVSKLKPRISYGVNGKIDVLGNFTSFGSYGSQGIYNGQTGYANTTLPNLDLKWEKSKTLNFGLDLSLFDNRLSFIADYFIRDVENKLANLTLPYWTGFSSILTNNGTLRNKGFELEFSADIIQSKDFQWNLRGTFTTYKNYVRKLPENDNERNRQGGVKIYNPKTGELEYKGGLQEGRRVGNDMIITYVQDHIYRDQADVDQDADVKDELLPDPYKRYPGDVAWKDANDDGEINTYDQQVIGRTTPDVYGGFSTSLNYKNWGLYIKTDYALGHKIYNHIRGKGFGQTQGNLNPTDIVLQSWTPNNRDTDVPRFVFVDEQSNIFRGDEGTVNSRFWENGDYLAIREVTLSYNLPAEWFDNAIKSLEVYVTGSNLYYFKSYSGPTPEQGGYQNGQFPMPRTFSLGFNLNF